MPLPFPTPPLVLAFGPSDPTAGGGIQADLLTCASLGCHALTVLTGYTVQDSAGIEDADALTGEWIDDQARSLLEDMPVRAFKVGALADPEAVSVVAQILADYATLPTVLHLSGEASQVRDAETEESAEDVLAATLELLVPQATVVVVDGHLLARLAADGLLPVDNPGEDGAQALLQMGADWVLATGLHHPGEQVINTLTGSTDARTAAQGGGLLDMLAKGQEAGDEGNEGADAGQMLVRTEYRQARLPGKFRGAGATLSAALAAMLAGGTDLEEAIVQAQDFTWRALAAGFHPGMGRYLPDRFFWAREADEPAAADAPSAAGTPAADGPQP